MVSVVAADHRVSTTTLAVLAVVLPFLGTVLGLAAGRWAEERNRRREGHAAAIRALVAWSEYPYRVRRRTSDDPAELRRLADLGHDLQEQLQCHRTWVRAESRRVGDTYDAAIATLKSRSGDALNDAWSSAPIAHASEMNLAGWGPGDVDDIVTRVNDAIMWRFGWRRILTAFGPTV